EPFQQEPEAVLIPEKQFDAIPPAIGEPVDGSGKRIERGCLFDNRRQPVNALPEIDWIAVQPHR
ncbi:hypothetical protein PQR07_41040, partial [Paraburkholderia aspalathi]